MSFWNGAFAKHRDYAHDSWFEHEMDDGGSYGVATETPVNAEAEPIEMKEFNGTRRYYPVRIVLSDGKRYDFFVPADKNGHYPNRDEIKAYVYLWNSTPMPDGEKRDPLMFLDEKSYGRYRAIAEDDTKWDDYQG